MIHKLNPVIQGWLLRTVCPAPYAALFARQDEERTRKKWLVYEPPVFYKGRNMTAATING